MHNICTIIAQYLMLGGRAAPSHQGGLGIVNLRRRPCQDSHFQPVSCRHGCRRDPLSSLIWTIRPTPDRKLLTNFVTLTMLKEHIKRLLDQRPHREQKQ